MQFEINNQPYFLNFIPEEGRWLLLKPTRKGIQVMPVVDDDASSPIAESDVEVVN